MMAPSYRRGSMWMMLPTAACRKVRLAIPVLILASLVLVILHVTDMMIPMQLLSYDKLHPGSGADDNQRGTFTVHMNNTNSNVVHKNAIRKDKETDKHVVPGGSFNMTATVTHHSKATHVAFLKVHKAASTTMQNMFFRFGLKHNLNIAIPKGGNLFNRKADALLLNNVSRYDIFACHTVYRKSFFDALLPRDSAKIGIVREPLDRMISAAFYYRDVWNTPYLRRVPKTNFIKNLVNYPEKYEPALFTFTRNSMALDFGFRSVIKDGLNSTADVINKYLRKLKREFSLVLLKERFQESLVLMRRLLKWSIADIIYLTSNTHAHNQIVLNSTQLQKFKSTSLIDYAVYDFFAKEFRHKLKKAGKSVVEEVKYLQEVLAKVQTFCEYPLAYKYTLSFNESKWDTAFTVVSSDCDFMKTSEVSFISMIRQKYIREKKVNSKAEAKRKRRKAKVP